MSESLLQAQSWGISHVQAEIDSQLLVQAINGGEQDLSKNGAIFREIKFQISLNFPCFSISYYPRACNQVADAMTSLGARSGLRPPAFCPGCVPDFVNVLVASDVAGLTV
jgi:hypothetical protein